MSFDTSWISNNGLATIIFYLSNSFALQKRLSAFKEGIDIHLGWVLEIMPGRGHIPFCVWFSIEDQRFWNVATLIPQLTLLKSQSGERLLWFLTWGIAEGALGNMSGGDLVAKSCLTLMTPWTVARQAPLSMGILQARILEWVAISFSRGSSWLRNRTRVSCIAGRFFTAWTTREALKKKNTSGALDLASGGFIAKGQGN